MKSINGNVTALIQTKTTEKNDIGESIETWEDYQSVKGWLDYSTGEANVTLRGKLEDTTHYFFCDAWRWPEGITEENARLMINSSIYHLLLIDNPMEMGAHLEIYLKHIGKANG